MAIDSIRTVQKARWIVKQRRNSGVKCINYKELIRQFTRQNNPLSEKKNCLMVLVVMRNN